MPSTGIPLEDGSGSEETLKDLVAKPSVVLKDGDLSYSEAVKKQEAARRYVEGNNILELEIMEEWLLLHQI
jgi:hypothetical protein